MTTVFGSTLRPLDGAARQEGREGPRQLRSGNEQHITLRSAEFRKGREQGWLTLEGYIARVEKSGIGDLTAAEVQQLPLLYRAVMSSLSVARSTVLDRNLLLYLENLSLRAYLVVYGPRSGVLENLAEFLARGFPRAVRSMGLHLLLVTVALIAGIFAGYVLVGMDAGYFSMFVPESLAGGRGPGSSTEYLKESIFAPWPGFVRTFVEFANSLFRHNSMVGIFSFGLGFFLGVPTIFLMIYNGLVLGAFIRLYADRDMTVDFIGWLSIHGVTELLAILLCGAAGLVIAEKILFPGGLPRLESLTRHGRQAASAAAGAVGMLFIAGILEGGFRQLFNDTLLRYAVAFATAAFWFWYFFCSARGGSQGNTRGNTRGNAQGNTWGNTQRNTRVKGREKGNGDDTN
ncbi:MAG: hypothetical protein DELT_01942 [Desulfovibrio sp.]